MRGIVELGPPPDATVWPRVLRRALVLLALSGLASAACSSSGARATDIHTAVNVPPSPVVETETVVRLKLFDSGGTYFPGARLRVEAHMSHPGMAPVVSQAVDEGKGAYTIGLRFPMAGVWVLQLKGELADRRTIDQPLGDVTVRPGG